MRPAASVILLTTLIGAGQGLFLAVLTAMTGARFGAWVLPPDSHALRASVVALALLGAGLLASFFHLGHPERAWRAASQWRTSWLSREVLVLPLVMLAVLLYALAHYPRTGGLLEAWRSWIAAAGALSTFALFVCTGMIYACLRFLQAWASPLTVVNFTLLGCASGLTIAAALAGGAPDALAQGYALAALAATLLAALARVAALARTARLRAKSTLATAIGVKHPRIEQRAAGFLGGSFNTREFFHGCSVRTLAAVRALFLLGAFALPVALIAVGLGTRAPSWFLAAACTQMLGLIAERWYFFAEATHPQNLYYRAVR